MTFEHHEVGRYRDFRFPDAKLEGKEWRLPCPIHSGTRLSFALNSQTGMAICHSQCGRGWDLISLEQELSGRDFIKAKEAVFEIVGRPRVPWEERDVESIYDYTDESGKLLYQVLRKTGKKFVQRKPNGSGGWTWGLEGVRRVPFRLAKLAATEFVALTEGEKDVLTLERIGITASCNSGGAGNFKPELADSFAGKHIAIFPDNDDPGRDHALKVARLLAPLAKSLKIVELPNLPEKGDVTDFVNRGGTVDQIREIYKKAQPWTPSWEFSSEVPSENEKHVRSLGQLIEECGGITAFWELSRLSGLETPWRRLSRILGGGMRVGEVYVLGANQGAGKTSLALQFIIAALRRIDGCLLFSMEMGWKSVFQRMAAIEAHVDLNELRECQYILVAKDRTQNEKELAQKNIGRMMVDLARVTSELSELPILVSTKPSVTPEHIIEETARLRKKQHIKFVVVDHMQLMGSTGNQRSDYEKFTAISRSIKQVAVELDVPVLLVSQTSRNQAKEHRGELEVSDLRGSGALEEDAAGVMLLYENREDKDLAMSEGNGDRYTKGPVKCLLKIGKNRYGEQGKCFELLHYKDSTRFEPVEVSA